MCCSTGGGCLTSHTGAVVAWTLALAATAVQVISVMRPALLIVAAVLLGCAPRDPNPTVWVNTRSGVYHCEGSQHFQSTADGQLALESDARTRGYRPADDILCGDGNIPAATDSGARLAGTPELPEYAGPRVWVNTQSGIYHCQGSQYYRSTGAGELMTEKDAVAAGHRPAGGRDCR
jgi:hypothetical protein